MIRTADGWCRAKWKTYLVKVNNEGRITSPLEVRSPQALAMEAKGPSLGQSSVCDANQPHDWSQWLLLTSFSKQPPMQTTLSGRELAFSSFSSAALIMGIRAAEIVFYLGGGQVSQGHYADTHMLFYIEARSRGVGACASGARSARAIYPTRRGVRIRDMVRGVTFALARTLTLIQPALESGCESFSCRGFVPDLLLTTMAWFTLKA